MQQLRRAFRVSPCAYTSAPVSSSLLSSFESDSLFLSSSSGVTKDIPYSQIGMLLSPLDPTGQTYWDALLASYPTDICIQQATQRAMKLTDSAGLFLGSASPKVDVAPDYRDGLTSHTRDQEDALAPPTSVLNQLEQTHANPPYPSETLLHSSLFDTPSEALYFDAAENMYDASPTLHTAGGHQVRDATANRSHHEGEQSPTVKDQPVQFDYHILQQQYHNDHRPMYPLSMSSSHPCLQTGSCDSASDECRAADDLSVIAPVHPYYYNQHADPTFHDHVRRLQLLHSCNLEGTTQIMDKEWYQGTLSLLDGDYGQILNHPGKNDMGHAGFSDITCAHILQKETSIFSDGMSINPSIHMSALDNTYCNKEAHSTESMSPASSPNSFWSSLDSDCSDRHSGGSLSKSNSPCAESVHSDYEDSNHASYSENEDIGAELTPSREDREDSLLPELGDELSDAGEESDEFDDDYEAHSSSSYVSHSASACSTRKTRKNYSRDTTTVLMDWYLTHDGRTPDPENKVRLAGRTKLSSVQISTWFQNARRRQQKKLEEFTKLNGKHPNEVYDYHSYMKFLRRRQSEPIAPAKSSSKRRASAPSSSSCTKKRRK
ncbi:uncharacterized protein BYT42DRAFT_617689 [Radiomyces spectabilis]|uniref:uncharacterized protein n=1 Tax=Radiomyces spectabilis TaxID=64574 RepID=UPI0022203FE9|nr:uncharacterized protein BYT42DRAFT_617689 [Radiomyces spectabilis]KAI8368140.1 hypothetical protein BYT42DRAFT_617689 [Radiomyces spectabilis]